MFNNSDSISRRRNSPAGSASPAPSWAAEEFKLVDLPDQRLNRRLIQILETMADQPMKAFTELFDAWGPTKAAYRFIENDAVDVQAILAAHQQSTQQRAQAYDRVLVPHDTTSFNYTRHPGTQGLGPIGKQVDGPQGLFLHHALAVSVAGEPLGVVHAQFWARDPADFHRAKRHPKLPLAEKESRKWLLGWRATEALARALPGTQVISVCDREADLYELLLAAAQTEVANVGLLVRARFDRQVTDLEPAAAAAATDQQVARYFEPLSQQPVVAQLKVRVPRQERAPARTATVAIRFSVLTLAPPENKSYQSPIQFYGVEAREIHPPAGVEGICWRLLYSRPVTTAAAAIACVQWYTKRWTIEVLHKVLKSGCQGEQRQFETAARLERMLGLYLVVAWRILALTTAARTQPDWPVSLWLEEAEWQTLACLLEPTPRKRERRPRSLKPPTVKAAVRAIAKLGGFLGRKGDGEPGPICLWRGLRRLRDMTDGFLLFQSMKSIRSCG